jgi:hypothetical protein
MFVDDLLNQCDMTLNEELKTEYFDEIVEGIQNLLHGVMQHSISCRRFTSCHYFTAHHHAPFVGPFMLVNLLS